MPNYDKENKRIAAMTAQISQLEAANKSLKAKEEIVNFALYETLHEVRRFTAEIYNNAEQLAKRLGAKADEINKELSNTIFYTSGMLSARLSLTTLQLNPAAAARQTAFKAGVYKKFEKARWVLASKAKSKRINVKLVGSSFTEISTITAFELVPFLILDNALKYSPPGMDVSIIFDESQSGICLVRISSIGPLVNQDELESIFRRGVRGVNSTEQSGEGLGLYLAKFLCDYHGLEIVAHSTPEKIQGVHKVPMGRFEIEMRAFS